MACTCLRSDVGRGMLYQDRLDAFFDSLLRVETQRGQEDVRDMSLPSKSQVAPGMTQPVLGTAGERSIRRHRWPCLRAERGNKLD
jgi:hypothetical protein